MERNYRVRDALLMLCCSILASISIPLLVRPESGSLSFALSLAAQQLGLLVAFGAIRRPEGSVVARLSAGRGATMLVVAVAAMALWSGALASVNGAPEQAVFVPLVGASATTSALGVWAGVGLAPIAEELLFRVVLFGALIALFRGRGARRSVLWAAIVSSLVFGLLHYEGGFWVPLQLTGFGLLACWLARSSVGLAIAFHAINNAWAFLGVVGDRVIVVAVAAATTGLALRACLGDGVSRTDVPEPDSR